MTTAAKGKSSRRAVIAIGILLLWGAGLGFLARRELFQPRLDRLAEAGLRINQYTSFFALHGTEDDSLVGYASSIVDTTTTEITITDQMIRELPMRRERGRYREVRASKSAKTRLSRTFKLKEFELRTNTGTVNLSANGRVEGDSLFYTVFTNGKPTKGVIRLDGPVLVPNLVPHAVALMNDPRVGRKYTLPVFDPTRQAIVQVTSEIQKETTFVIADSAVLDSTTRQWKPFRNTEMKAWLVRSSAGGFNGWLDETGHIVRSNDLDAVVTRSTIEEAFENWLVGLNRRRRAVGLLPADTTPAPKPQK